MIDRFLDGLNYYDFPSFEVALFSLLLSFILSSLIALSFRFTFNGDYFPNHLFQAMILSSIVTAMIMMAVGNNLAVGFGIIGAVAIIRFRTLINNPRNIIFMFAGISVGIATGVYGYAIAIAGTAVFCVVAFLLRFSSFNYIQIVEYELTINFENFEGNIDEILSDFIASKKLMSQRKNREGKIREEYLLKLKEGASPVLLFEKLGQIQEFSEVRLDQKEINNKL